MPANRPIVACLVCALAGASGSAWGQDGLRAGYGMGGPLLAPLPEPQRASMPLPDPVDLNDPGFGYPVGTPLDVAPQEPLTPPVQIDWSVGLRGSYTKGTERNYYEALVAPQVAATYSGVRGSITGSANAEIARPSNDELRLRGLTVTVGGGYQFDPVMRLDTTNTLTVTQDSPNDPSLSSAVDEAAVEIAGRNETTLTRDFGRFSGALRGSVERNVYGDTLLTDGTWVDNSSNNRTELGAGLRVSYQMTPILSPFVDGSLARDYYDEAAPGLGDVRADGVTYELRTGIAGKWGETLEAEASVGWGWRDFIAGEIGDVDSTLYNASVTYRPNRSLTLGGQIGTSFEPPGPDNGGATRIEYVASANVGYKINDWLGVRAEAGWSLAEIEPEGGTERGHSVGVGADYLVNGHTSLNADYDYGHSETVANPSTESHRVMLGVTIKK